MSYKSRTGWHKIAVGIFGFYLDQYLLLINFGQGKIHLFCGEDRVATESIATDLDLAEAKIKAQRILRVYLEEQLLFLDEFEGLE